MATSDSTPDTITIPLTKGYSTIIDAADADLANAPWFVSDSGPKSKHLYAKRTVRTDKGKRTSEFMHRSVASRMLQRLLSTTEQVDHINGDTLDNRRSNLRVATTSQNAANSKPQTGRTSKFKGVAWDKARGKWTAGITINYKRNNLGRFETEEEAHEAYCKAAEKHFGSFARSE